MGSLSGREAFAKTTADEIQRPSSVFVWDLHDLLDERVIKTVLFLNRKPSVTDTETLDIIWDTLWIIKKAEELDSLKIIV